MEWVFLLLLEVCLSSICHTTFLSHDFKCFFFSSGWFRGDHIYANFYPLLCLLVVFRWSSAILRFFFWLKTDTYQEFCNLCYQLDKMLHSLVRYHTQTHSRTVAAKYHLQIFHETANFWQTDEIRSLGHLVSFHPNWNQMKRFITISVWWRLPVSRSVLFRREVVCAKFSNNSTYYLQL